MVIGSDDECDPDYVPPGTLTPTRATRTTRSTTTKVEPGRVTASQSEESTYLPAHLLGRLHILRERMSTRRLPVRRKRLALRMLLSLRRFILLLMPMLQSLQSSLPRLMRLIVLILLQHHKLMSPLWFLIIQTSGVSRANIKYMLMPRFPTTRGSRPVP